MTTETIESAATVADKTQAAHAAWVAAHGKCKPVARSTIHSRGDGEIIISTVLVACGFKDFGPDDGPFVAYESKVFGGTCDGQSVSCHSLREAILGHVELFNGIVGSYLGS